MADRNTHDADTTDPLAVSRNVVTGEEQDSSVAVVLHRAVLNDEEIIKIRVGNSVIVKHLLVGIAPSGVALTIQNVLEIEENVRIDLERIGIAYEDVVVRKDVGIQRAIDVQTSIDPDIRNPKTKGRNRIHVQMGLPNRMVLGHLDGSIGTHPI